MSQRTITFVTGNANKLNEVRAILAASPNFPFALVNQALDVPEVQGTTADVARAKCAAAAAQLNAPVITEDTALGFTALGGLPGPYIKDFLGTLGHDGLNKLLAGFADKSAHAICTFAYSAGAGQPVLLFEGRTAGLIVPARGPANFGWDPILEIDGTGKTYAEMQMAEKNALSHRYKALAKLQEYLVGLGAESADAA
ncbi:putative HAM1-protein [Tilletiopsis washingtonensis]|uniref:Inosine triphosphate pyrophosphatase n=1 Tax=Tilletiopsis washingtonensis TaxID=58919 RepID=A0A316Z6F4_9BASI|nr:putative HAM1-protein [Tilletiopsis washingtonensis]PWN97199.1 putative HAM1-protein [Tilletiopsis washingtonensis]